MRGGGPEKIKKPWIRVGWPNDMILGESPGLQHYQSIGEFVVYYAKEHNAPVWCSIRVYDPSMPFYRDNTHIAVGYPDGRWAKIPLEDLPPDWREEARRPIPE